MRINLVQNINEEKFRLLFEQNPEALILSNANAFIDCNLAALKVFGCKTVEQFCNLHPSELSPERQPDNENSSQKANIKIELALTAGVQFFEWEYKRYDSGESFIAEVFLSCIFINDEPVFQAIVRDITERKHREQNLNQAMIVAEESVNELRVKNDGLATLLNNSGQGFFSFGADLKIVGEYSQACIHLLGQIPTGLDADSVLFPFTDDHYNRKLMRSCIEDALQASSPDLARMFLDLIPTELIGNGKVLNAQYIPIKTGVMVVLTDVTAEVELKKSAELESKRMAMILAAVTDGPEFMATIDDFLSFCKAGPEPWLTQKVASLYRAIHTFKGSFNQFRFTHVPTELHQLEAFLQDLPILQNLLSDSSAGGILDIVFETNWKVLLNRDLGIVTSVLGDKYLRRTSIIPLPKENARAIEQMANELLDIKKVKFGHEILLKELSELRYISLHEELANFSKLVQQVAVKLEKELLPLEINGHDLRLDPDIYRQFLLTLGHVMRNAIDHGIEDPETRYEKGKNEAGTIHCTTQRIANEFELTIQDDGAGINETILRLHASKKLNINVDSLTLTDLIFADGFSSRETATEISGRGIGMAAVREEVERLGGSIAIETVIDQGTRFIFRIPILKNIAVA